MDKRQAFDRFTASFLHYFSRSFSKEIHPIYNENVIKIPQQTRNPDSVTLETAKQVKTARQAKTDE